MLTRSPPWLMQSARASAHVLMDSQLNSRYTGRMSRSHIWCSILQQPHRVCIQTNTEVQLERRSAAASVESSSPGPDVGGWGGGPCPLAVKRNTFWNTFNKQNHYSSIRPFLQINSFVDVQKSSLRFPASWWSIPLICTQSSLFCQSSGWLGAPGSKS